MIFAFNQWVTSMSDRIRQTALNTIQIEAKALEQLTKYINDDFVKSVGAILSTDGRIVVTGIGKSAIIGQKIVATLNSTGTPSIFLHAADAIHGDLGMIREEDVLLCISKSGETSEVKALVPILQNLGVTIIAMTSDQNSYLGKAGTYVLQTPIAKEADPNNLAPTASTSAQLAMGDALAMAIQVERGFTPADFAQYHPGGTLGKRLYLKVEHLYAQNEKPAVQTTSTIRETIIEITSKRLGMTVVLDGSMLVGIITDGDLRRMLEKDKDTTHLTAKDIMSTGPKIVGPDTMAVDALDLMKTYSITQLVVSQNDKYLGVLHLHDIIKEGII